MVKNRQIRCLMSAVEEIIKTLLLLDFRFLLETIRGQGSYHQSMLINRFPIVFALYLKMCNQKIRDDKKNVVTFSQKRTCAVLYYYYYYYYCLLSEVK